MAHQVHPEKESNAVTLWNLLSIVVPSLIAVIGVVLAARWVRQSSRESNSTESRKTDNDAFKIVTDQLFALNEDLQTRLTAVENEVKVLKAEKTALEAELESTEQKWQMQIAITKQLANYIKRLIAKWPANAGPPPSPQPPIDWNIHL